MTVTELRKKLQSLEDCGCGTWKVVKFEFLQDLFRTFFKQQNGEQ